MVNSGDLDVGNVLKIMLKYLMSISLLKMDFKQFFKSEIRLEILYLLKNKDQIFINQFAKELNHYWSSIYKVLNSLLEMKLIKISRYEKARGIDKRRKYYSLTNNGKRFIRLLDELLPLINTD